MNSGLQDQEEDPIENLKKSIKIYTKKDGQGEKIDFIAMK